MKLITHVQFHYIVVPDYAGKQYLSLHFWMFVMLLVLVTNRSLSNKV